MMSMPYATFQSFLYISMLSHISSDKDITKKHVLTSLDLRCGRFCDAFDGFLPTATLDMKEDVFRSEHINEVLRIIDSERDKSLRYNWSYDCAIFS